MNGQENSKEQNRASLETHLSISNRLLTGKKDIFLTAVISDSNQWDGVDSPDQNIGVQCPLRWNTTIARREEINWWTYDHKFRLYIYIAKELGQLDARTEVENSFIVDVNQHWAIEGNVFKEEIVQAYTNESAKLRVQFANSHGEGDGLGRLYIQFLEYYPGD